MSVAGTCKLSFQTILEAVGCRNLQALFSNDPTGCRLQEPASSLFKRSYRLSVAGTCKLSFQTILQAVGRKNNLSSTWLLARGCCVRMKGGRVQILVGPKLDSLSARLESWIYQMYNLEPNCSLSWVDTTVCQTVWQGPYLKEAFKISTSQKWVTLTK